MAATNNQLENLKKHTVIVADTGDFNTIKQFNPEDATTNPSLIFKAATMKEYASLVDAAVEYAKTKPEADQMEACVDKLAVNFGCEILKLVEGKVSTEVDARLSYDTKATIAKVRTLYKLYEEAGIDPKKRVLFKIASTWEGIVAMKELQAEGINCNMTLLFNLYQAAACAEYGAFLISPFVGRITDYQKVAEKRTELPPIEQDSGVKSVAEIYEYYKVNGYKTVVMGASFRSAEQVLALAGCDRLTVAPKWLSKMQNTSADVPLLLDASKHTRKPGKLPLDENNFRWALGSDPMATEKLANGIRRFGEDTVKLELLLQEKGVACGKLQKWGKNFE